MQKQQAARLSEQQKQELLQQIQVSMASQANDLFSSWNAPPAQQRVVGDESKVDGATGVAGGAAGTAAGGKGGQAAVNGQTIKAGTIMFATLDTGINSDEESPILATIVQGKLKGTKLLGQFKRVEKKVVLSFSVMSVPNLSNSLTVNAVAIDPDTARTAVASDVDSHYLLRYGTLFASSFMSGFGQAVSESGATVVDKSSGDTLITNPATSTQEKGMIALGEVGKQFGKQFGSLAHTPPTVKVDAGSGLGILFMADTVVPEGN
jgi:intracellular multiplication protein IcmE